MGKQQKKVYRVNVSDFPKYAGNYTFNYNGNKYTGNSFYEYFQDIYPKDDDGTFFVTSGTIPNGMPYETVYLDQNGNEINKNITTNNKKIVSQVNNLSVNEDSPEQLGEVVVTYQGKSDFDKALDEAYKKTGLQRSDPSSQQESSSFLRFLGDAWRSIDNGLKREFGWAGYGGKNSPRFKAWQAAANKNPNFMENWDIAQNAFEGLNYASNGLFGKASPSQLVGFLRDVYNGKNVLDAWYNPNSGFVTEEYARNNPKKAFAINFGGDIAFGTSLLKGKSMYNAGKNSINKYRFQRELNNAAKNFKVGNSAFLNNRNPTATIFGDNYYHVTGRDFTEGIGTVGNSNALADAANKSQSFWSYKMPWGERVYGNTTYEVPQSVFGDRVATTSLGKPRPGVSVIDQGNAKFIDRYYPQTGEVYIPKGRNKFSMNFYNQEGSLQYQPHIRYDKTTINGVPTEIEVITGNTNRPNINGYYDFSPDFNNVRLGNQTTIPSQEANTLLQNSTYKFYPTFNIGTKHNPITIFGKGIHVTK